MRASIINYIIINSLEQTRPDFLLLLVESLSTQTASRLLELNKITEDDLVYLTKRNSFDKVAKLVSCLNEDNVESALTEAKINMKQSIERLSIKADKHGHKFF